MHVCKPKGFATKTKNDHGGDPLRESLGPPPSMWSPQCILLSINEYHIALHYSTKISWAPKWVDSVYLWSEKSWRHRPRDNRLSGMNSDLGLTEMDMTLLTSWKPLHEEYTGSLRWV
jgi:hypothetical protein